MAKKTTQAGRLAGQLFIFVGNLGYRDTLRDKYAAAIVAAGGWVVDAGSVALDYIVAGEGRGGKPPSAVAQLAKKHSDAAVIDEAWLCRLLLPSPDELASLLRAGEQRHTYWEDFRTFTFRGKTTISLAGFDLRGAAIAAANLLSVRLDGADLRKASAQYANFTALAGVKFDGADLTNAYLENAERCSFRKAAMSKAWFDHGNADTYRDCDFTRANLAQARGENCSFLGCAFDAADLSDVEMEKSDFSGVSFAKADLSRAHLAGAKFDGAKLAGATLYRADLRGASLTNADLTKADLREAVLDGADLTGARVDGADFAGAGLNGAKTAGVDFSRTKNYQPPVVRAAGPKLRELAQAANSKEFITTAEVDLGTGEHAKLSVWRGRNFLQARSDYRRDDNDATDLIPAPTIEQGMLNLARRWPQATLRLDTVTARGSRTLRGKKLLDLATAAWAEAFALDATAPADLERQKAAQQAELAKLRETMLKELRGGAAGVKKWNARSEHEREKIGPLRGLDLKGLNLAGIELFRCDLDGSNFEGANLKKTRLGSCKLRHANFARADLSGGWLGFIESAGASFEGAKLVGCKMFLAELHGANLRGADLSRTELRSARLQGADLTGARVEGVDFQAACYDVATKFPEGFVPPASMERIADPPSLVNAAPGSMDFETFFEKLGEKVDPTRLTNATRMLKAERFQLFADVTDEALVGVVRSQTSGELVYSCRLASDGTFGCCTQNLRACGGLQGALCKHLLVLVVGLTRAGRLDPASVDAWVNASKSKKPVLDKEAMSETFIRYKGAEAGEIDWRPTETVPEDYYAL